MNNQPKKIFSNIKHGELQGIFCSVSHSEKLCKFSHLLIKFVID